MDEKDMRLDSRSRSPKKRSIKERLGVRKGVDEVEVFNMDINEWLCGAVGIIKEYVDDNMGIMELRISEGGRGAVILFSAEEMWIPDR